MGKHLLLAIPGAKAVNAAAGINSMHSATDARIASFILAAPIKKVTETVTVVVGSRSPE
jgi:hypothetical protein